jgi:hypothetical protein
MITDALGRDVVINFAVLVLHRIHCSNAKGWGIARLLRQGGPR